MSQKYPTTISKMLLSSVFLSACNSAPSSYLTDDIVQGAQRPYDHPTSSACDEFGNDTDPLIDGYRLCLQENNIMPIDDPTMVSCARTTLHDSEEVFYAFDGTVAKAYPLVFLSGRELVHDDWLGSPVLVVW